MDTYILREGKQTGPFSDETIRRLLQQGSVLQADLAWRKGMAGWIPLQEVLKLETATVPAGTASPAASAPLAKTERTPLNPATPAAPPAGAITPAAAKSTPAPATKPASAPGVEPASAASGESASPRQKAFLSYMGINFPQEIGKEQAALLINEAMENTKDPARLARWNEDRFRLYPDLYAAEIQAKKENRANRFFDLAETEGADCFDGLGKAHCQVLVGYLDVKFPNWDARESEATWNYFFPAIAEKFPDVVRREWRSKLKYPVGGKVAAELKGRSPSTGLAKRPEPSPVLALFKGLAIGAVAVAATGTGIFLLKHPAKSAPAANLPPSAAAPASKPADPKPPVETASGTKPQSQKTEPQPPEDTEASANATTSDAPATLVPPLPGLPGYDSTAATPGPTAVPPKAATPAKAGGSTAALDPKPAEGAPAAPDSTSARAANPAAASLDALFGAPAAPQPAASAPKKTSVVLTKPVDVPVPFGQAKLLPGTQLKLVAQEGDIVKVNYLNMIVPIPVSSTDLADEAPK